MPCFSGTISKDAQIAEDRRRKLEMVEAVLCGVLRVFPGIFHSVDWEQAGVKREWAEKWWIEHQEKDRRREQIAIEREKNERKMLEELKKKYE